MPLTNLRSKWVDGDLTFRHRSPTAQGKILLLDGVKLAFGSNADVAIYFDGDEEELVMTGAEVIFDWTAGFRFEDNIVLSFGDDDDVTLVWDGGKFVILPDANDTLISAGNGTKSFDVKLYGSASGNFLSWDASDNALTAGGSATIRTLPAIADPGNAGAIPVTKAGYVPLVSAGAETRTLAAPSYIGQEMLIYGKTLAGAVVVTVATTVNQDGDNTITFSTAGDSVRLIAVEVGSNKRWRCAVADGAVLSTV
jgi:hypothetical protein